MPTWLHRVVGLYPSQREAETMRDRILAKGFAPRQVRIFGSPAEGADVDDSSLLRDALASGQAVLVVHAETEDETACARQTVSGPPAADDEDQKARATAPPPKPRPLEAAKADFTAEGAPPPGRVATEPPLTPKPSAGSGGPEDTRAPQEGGR